MISAGRVLVVLGMVAALFAGTASSASAWTLTVDKNAPGYVSGTGIDCGSDCSETYSNNCAYDPDVGGPVCDPTPATVTASDANGFSFSSWNGCDSVDGANCTVDGGINTTVTANFNDVQAPTATLTAPAAGIRAGTFAITGTATDNSDQIAAMRFYVRGSQVGTDTTAPYSVNFDSTTITDGSAQIAVQAVDPSNNVSSSATTTVTIDNVAPALAPISGPGAGPFGPNTTQSFSWTASDSGSGIKSVQCKLDASAYGACATSSTVSYSNLGDGSHTLTVLVTDNADRTSSRTYTWAID